MSLSLREQVVETGESHRRCVFSGDYAYRYTLTRRLRQRGWPLIFIMLNPSTADSLVSDPTVTRCERYARRWGAAWLVVLNLFALRSTDPAALYAADDPVGPDNDNQILFALLDAARDGGRAVCAWGNHGRYRNRDRDVLEMIKDVGVDPLCLRVNAAMGTPAHPLYLPADLTPVPYVPPQMDG